MRSNSPQKTIATVPTAGPLDGCLGRPWLGCRPPSYAPAQRWPPRRGPQLGTRVTGCRSPTKEAVDKSEGSVDAICEATVIDDVFGHLAIKKNRPARRRRAPAP
jgi:hypothetical protein